MGTQLLNIARIGSLVVDAPLHAEAARNPRQDAPAYREAQAKLAAIKTEALLPRPIYTVTGFDPAVRQARIAVASDGMTARPGDSYAVPEAALEPLGWTFQDGVARYTRIYRNATGAWISAFGPLGDGSGAPAAVMVVDYSVDVYFERLHQLQIAILEASVVGALGAGLVGLFVARRVTRPVSALTRAVGRVARGDLSQALPVVSRDEVGQLTRAFNEMLEGLRQRDFIRDTFGRYVSPEVARTLLESPEGLKLGGEKRVVTILMSDLRGYTRFAEQGDPAWVMDVLNGYLARMTDIVIAHGGTINEFIGDAIFAVFGAPLAHADHAERAAATALAMQGAMAEINAMHEARGLPRFEMGIGIHTGEAVVGNIGSEQRAKYAVVGSAVNVAARVEGCTVGGQVFLSDATCATLRPLVEVAPPISVEVKGLSAPLVLHELRAIQGQFARRLPEASVEQDRQVDVAIAVRYWRLDGKTVEGDGHAGLAVRLGPRRIDVRLAEPLPPLTNVRIRLARSEAGRESGDLYGKVVVVSDATDGGTAIRLTSVDAADQRTIEMLVSAGLNPVDTAASAR